MLGLLIGLTILVVLIVVYYINRIIRLGNRVENAWSQIDVQLKKRSDLIPKLVQVVKGYAKHERETFEQITKMRSLLLKALNNKNLKDTASADAEISQLLKRLLLVAENYPELKANQNFLMLQEEITAVEDKIAFARQLYNDLVMRYNNLCEKFPSNIIAKLFNFKKFDFYKATNQEREDITITF